MRHSTLYLIPTKRRAVLLQFTMLLACAIVASSALAQSATTTTSPQGATMPKFALIFRQSPFPMTEEVKQRRVKEVAAWATHLRDTGHTLEPHLLGEEHAIVVPGGSSPRETGDPIVAILVFDAPSFDDAKQIASTHPGLNYGISIEVRPATIPAFPPSTAPSR